MPESKEAINNLGGVGILYTHSHRNTWANAMSFLNTVTYLHVKKERRNANHSPLCKKNKEKIKMIVDARVGEDMGHQHFVTALVNMLLDWS